LATKRLATKQGSLDRDLREVSNAAIPIAISAP
jgi:hypothetical protein